MASYALPAADLAVLAAVLALICSVSTAFDPSPLQDFCVSDLNSQAIVNGFACKNPANVTVDDFVFSGINRRAFTANRFGSNVTLVNARTLPGLNTMGISLARIDYQPGGVNPPHTHPRATEILTVLQGTLYAGFLTPPPSSRLFAKVLNRGDVIVFPIGSIQFQMNVGNKHAVSLSSLSSQNPGLIPVAATVFGAQPAIRGDALARAFQIEKEIIDHLQSLPWTNDPVH